MTEIEILKPYFVFNWRNPSPCECGCCCSSGVIQDNGGYMYCLNTGQEWFVVKQEPDFTKPHEREVCMGDCPFHPLHTKDIHVLSNVELYQTTWGDYMGELETAALASETPEQREQRFAREAKQAEEDKKKMKAVAIESYTRKMGDQAMRGVGKGEGPKKFDRPCRWMVGPDAAAAHARSEKPCCWAWEYTDPKTNKFMKPRTCPYQHPDEAGWHEEWLTDPRFKPTTTQENNRFAALNTIHSFKRRRS